jgi:hypothetical protein
MLTFVAIYRGSSVTTAKLIAVSTDPSLVADVSARLLQKPSDTNQDPVVGQLEHGRQEALRLIEQEAIDECRR